MSLKINQQNKSVLWKIRDVCAFLQNFVKKNKFWKTWPVLEKHSIAKTFEMSVVEVLDTVLDFIPKSETHR